MPPDSDKSPAGLKPFGTQEVQSSTMELNLDLNLGSVSY